MPHRKGDNAYLWDMLAACQNVVSFVKGKSFKDYEADVLLRSGVERQVEIVGEAARYISSTFQEQHPEIPWRKIMAQRHIITHEYGDIESEIIWRVATIHIPLLIAQLQALVPPPPTDTTST